jgi:hypothetical protein
MNKGWRIGAGQRFKKLLIINIVKSITEDRGGEFPESLDVLGLSEYWFR